MKSIEFIDRETGEIVSEHPPGEAYLRFLYHHPLGKIGLEALVKRKVLSTIYGRLMNKASSVKKIMPFVEEFKINMEEAEKPIEGYTSFNDFFFRKLKPGTRPVKEGLVSPGDGKILAFESLDDLGIFFVKGNEFTLDRFLESSELADDFRGGSMLILRLAPNDYHRFHFPYSGTASAPVSIKGSYYSVSPYAVIDNFTRIFCENKRSYILLQTQNEGRIIISPVGATMVGSIIHTYTPYTEVSKGDELGYFAFGGSTIVVLVQKDHFEISGDLLDNTKKGMETAIRMGDTIGRTIN